MKSFAGVQVFPSLVLFQTPPPTAPAHKIFGLTGSMTSERVRPPTFRGPRETHEDRETEAAWGNAYQYARLSRRCAAAVIKAFFGISPFSSTQARRLQRIAAPASSGSAGALLR